MKTKLLKTLLFFMFLLLSMKFLILSYEKDFFMEAIILLAFVIILIFICERLKTLHTKVCGAKKVFDRAKNKFEEEKLKHSKDLSSCNPSDLTALQMRYRHFTEDFEEQKSEYNDFMRKYPKFLINIIKIL